VYDFTGKPVDLWKTFRPFLNAAHARLNKPLVFNNVGGYGLYDTAAHADIAAVYVECWPFAGQATYNELKTVIDQAASWSGGKAVVLAAYMDYERSKAAHGRKTETFNAPGVLLTDAAIFASGGAHIELGDGAQMLGSEYFPNRNLRLSPALRNALRNYYDFLVGYENILRGGLQASTGSIVLNVPSSTDATPQTVWAFAKHGDGHHVLHLINLIGENSAAWRDDQGKYPAPTVQTNIIVTYHYGPGKVKNVSWASPDARDIAPRPLPFTTGADAGGAYVRFTIPRLAYWDMATLTMAPESHSQENHP
nr:glycoside hydrolase family 66 protein [Armatimonadota bacterium]